MIRQIKYFQAVVRNNSFSDAADECHISQSAISQQIQSLENTLGFPLLQRKNRKFTVTPAGVYFYKKSLVLIADYERMCIETAKIAHAGEHILCIGFLRGYYGHEFQCALSVFAAQFPAVSIRIKQGTHEELFEMLRIGKADLVCSDQRRAFSDEYINLILEASHSSIEVSVQNPISLLDHVTLQDLKNTPCILIAPTSQRAHEENYYRDVLGVQSRFLFADNLESARLLAGGNHGFIIGRYLKNTLYPATRCIPLYRDDRPVIQTYCAFWKKSVPSPYAEKFTDILKRQFNPL